MAALLLESLWFSCNDTQKRLIHVDCGIATEQQVSFSADKYASLLPPNMPISVVCCVENQQYKNEYNHVPYAWEPVSGCCDGIPAASFFSLVLCLCFLLETTDMTLALSSSNYRRS